MNNIQHIKPFYAPPEVQDDLREDGLTLMGINISGNFKHYNKRPMTKKEIDNIIQILYNVLINENNLSSEWDQTS